MPPSSSLLCHHAAGWLLATVLMAQSCLIMPGPAAAELLPIEIDLGLYAHQEGDPTVLYEPHVDTLYAETMKLVPIAHATCIAKDDGAWSAAGTWSGGVPGDGDRVHIPAGITVTYDRDSTAAIDWIRVDGTMRFATDRDTTLHVDTWVVGAAGTLIIGDEAEPIPAAHRVTIRFTNDGELSQSQDPHLLGRGLIACGTARMHGQRKSTWHRIANRPEAGETTVILEKAPLNWQAGDDILLPGGWQEGNGESPSHEHVTLEAVDSNVLTVSALTSHHRLDPDAPAVFAAHAINLSRNITFANADPSAGKTPRSGYVSFLRSHDVDIRYVAFIDIGRSDKRIPVDDPIIQLTGDNQVLNPVWEEWHFSGKKGTEPTKYITGTGSNPRRRHSVQFYRHGSWHSDREPSLCKGCTMTGGPGWSFANIDSNVTFADCAAVHFMAAGFATDMGAEQGIYRRNIAVENNLSMSPKFGPRRAFHDNGSSGDGFNFQGRNLVIEDNVAIDCGFVQHIRSVIYGPKVHQDVLLMPPATTKLDDDMHHHRCGLVDVRRNQIYGAGTGFQVIKNGDGLQHHDMRNRLYRIETYNCTVGISIGYVTKYTLIKPIAFANRTGDKWDRNHGGMQIGGRVSETTLVDPQIHGYARKGIFGTRPDKENKGPTDVLMVGGNITQNDIWIRDSGEWVDAYDPALHRWLDPADVVPGRLTFTQQTPGIQPLPDQLGKRDHFFFKGTRVDSLGSEDLTREFDSVPGATGRASYWDGRDLLDHMGKGYWTTSTDYLGTPAGTKVLKLVDLFADRQTNEHILHPFLVSLPHDYGGALGPELGSVDPKAYFGGGAGGGGGTPDGRVIDLRLLPTGWSGTGVERLSPAGDLRTIGADGSLEEGPFPGADPSLDQIFGFREAGSFSDG